MKNQSSDVLKVDDLCPDGIRIVVAWDSMVVGASIFVPCINTETARTQAMNIMRDRGWSATARVRNEDNKLGVRIWRVL